MDACGFDWGQIKSVPAATTWQGGFSVLSADTAPVAAPVAPINSLECNVFYLEGQFGGKRVNVILGGKIRTF